MKLDLGDYFTIERVIHEQPLHNRPIGTQLELVNIGSDGLLSFRVYDESIGDGEAYYVTLGCDLMNRLSRHSSIRPTKHTLRRQIERDQDGPDTAWAARTAERAVTYGDW